MGSSSLIDDTLGLSHTTGASPVTNIQNCPGSIATRANVNHPEVVRSRREVAAEVGQTSIKQLQPLDALGDLLALASDKPRQLTCGVGAMTAVTHSCHLGSTLQWDLEAAEINKQP
jgi:hypothetical protein